MIETQETTGGDEVADPPSAMSPSQQPGAEPGSMVFDGSGGSVLQGSSQTMTLNDSVVGGIDSSPIVKRPVRDTGSSTRSVAKPAASGLSTPQSLSYQKTYYIYTFDGKLIAEYDQTGQCTREYIYLGGKLIAEYRPMSDKYFYYTADQINSTRVVTDGSGNVVYSATYSPFGKKIQSSQTIDDSPTPQFSNKEREQTTNLDYFGARYYDHATYRFNSTDPIINKKEAIANPQLWNLYAYCRNNPVGFLDPDGRASNEQRKYKAIITQQDQDDLIIKQAKEYKEHGRIITRPHSKNSIFDHMSPMQRRKTITKIGIALQISVAGLAGRGELYFYFSDDRRGLGGAIGGGGTTQVLGVAVSSFDTRAPKNPRKGPAVVSSVAYNYYGIKFAGVSGEWGDNMFSGGGMELGATVSWHKLEQSNLVMYDTEF